MKLATQRRVLVLAAVLSGIGSPTLGVLVAHRAAYDYRGLVPGERVPDAFLSTPDGEAVDTRDWRGRPTFLVLQRSACPACGAQAETLRSLARYLPELRIVLLATDGQAREEQPPLLSVIDPTGGFLRRAQRVVVPASYWADADGTVRFARIGTLPPAAELALLRRLAARFGSSSAPPHPKKE
jgi:hypothetical protein